ncbi:unnamed protein product [Brachionus calyciflorus]|uniref:Uncharacterized protein n=1 Tax=Brachionus calyciflorus TaxID=104777 RepID=A0A813M6S8_9BILA|nr:unnamed protein product [Brachionus calyciflorus]
MNLLLLIPITLFLNIINELGKVSTESQETNLIKKYLLTNLEISENAFLNEFEFIVLKPGVVSFQLVKLKSCSYAQDETCSNYLAKNYKKLNTNEDFEILTIHQATYPNVGVQKLSIESQFYVRNNSFILLTQYNGSELAIDTSGDSKFSDFEIDTKNFLNKLNDDKNYKIFMRASLIPFMKNDSFVKYIGRPIPENIPSDISTMAFTFLDFILLGTRFEEDSVVTGVEIVLNENPIFNRIGLPIDIGFLEFDFCKSRPEILNCISYVKNHSQFIDVTFDEYKFRQINNLQNGYNMVSFNDPFVVPKGTFVILRDNPLAIAVNKNIGEAQLSHYQINLTYDDKMKKRQSPCMLIKPNWSYYLSKSEVSQMTKKLIG